MSSKMINMGTRIIDAKNQDKIASEDLDSP